LALTNLTVHPSGSSR